MKLVNFSDLEKFYDQELCQKAFDTVKNEKDSGRIGYYKLPETSREILQRVKNLSDSNKNFFDGIKNVVVMGIGGSSLGTKALNSLLKHKNPNLKNLVFLENSDPINIASNLKGIEKENSVFCLISKSGTTIETISIFKTVITKLSIDLNQDSKQILIITDKGSNLSKFADEHKIEQFNIPLNVGGRFSVLSAVGIVPLYLCGYNADEILNSAQEMFDSFWNKQDDSVIKMASYLFKNHDNMPITVLFSYSNLLEDFTKWFVQLWGESLGKIDSNGKRVGLTPIGLIGSVDQHSFLQLVIEGPKNKTMTFINVDDFESDLRIPNISLPFLEKTDFANGEKFNKLINAQCDATFQSVKNCEISAQKLTFEQLNEKSISQAFVYFELLTSLVGAMLNVNTYDQPGVELGKNILAENFAKEVK